MYSNDKILNFILCQLFFKYKFLFLIKLVKQHAYFVL